MWSSFESILPLLFLTPAIALLLPPSLSLTTPNPASLSLFNSTDLNVHPNHSFSNLTSKTGITCSKVYGEGLSVDSCRNAWQKIHRASDDQRFLPRSHGRAPSVVTSGDVVVPFRYLSDDGICAIDLSLATGSKGDVATGNLVFSNAEKVFNQCVVHQGKGGFVKDFSRVDDLHITIRSYKPVVDCEPRPYAAPSEEDCEAVLAKVPAYKKKVLFGTTDDWRTVPGRLPREFFIPPTTERSCHVLVSMPSDLPPTMAEWFDIWAAGVAVNTMCVKHGFTGQGVWLGDNEKITITLGVVGIGTAQNTSAAVESKYKS